MAKHGAYNVYVDDVFDLYDTSRRYCAGTYDSYEDAEAHCKKIIDDFVKEYGSTEENLSLAYMLHGESPFIMPSPKGKHFSASKYFTEATKKHFNK